MILLVHNSGSIHYFYLEQLDMHDAEGERTGWRQ